MVWLLNYYWTFDSFLNLWVDFWNIPKLIILQMWCWWVTTKVTLIFSILSAIYNTKKDFMPPRLHIRWDIYIVVDRQKNRNSDEISGISPEKWECFFDSKQWSFCEIMGHQKIGRSVVHTPSLRSYQLRYVNRNFCEFSLNSQRVFRRAEMYFWQRHKMINCVCTAWVVINYLFEFVVVWRVHGLICTVVDDPG